MKRTVLLAAMAATMGVASTAHAIVLPFTGSGASGVDPLGHAWAVSPSLDIGQDPSWGAPGQVAGTERFNINDVSNSNGDFATGFLFVVRGGLDGAIATDANTRLRDVSTGELWSRQFLGTKGVLFTAPTGSAMYRFDEFLINVGFTREADLGNFAFAARWLDSPLPGGADVPEPATWALMLAGFGLVGATLRRRLVAVAT